MSKEVNKEDVTKNKNEAIHSIERYLSNCISSDNKHTKKANLISYWLKDYIRYVEQEETFNSAFLKEYSRGDVIKVNLGFNIGNEEGGLHYCVVLDKKNAKSYSTLTVVPLSSLKNTSKLNKTSVLLGDEIYKKVAEKALNLLNSIDRENAERCQDKAIRNYEAQRILDEITTEERQAMADLKAKIPLIEKITAEFKQMKKGTIALANQITTISKQRIYDPKKDFDILAGIKVSEEKMKLIDEKIKKLYLN